MSSDLTHPARHTEAHQQATVDEKINRHCSELVSELRLHEAEFARQFPGSQPGEAFQNWVIQKLAALQVAILEVGEAKASRNGHKE